MRYRNLTHLTVLAAGLMLLVFSSSTFGHGAPSARPSPATPLMSLLDRFTAADVPAVGPAEIAVAPRKGTTNPVPADLPGKGLAQHPMLYIGEGCNKMFLINNGKILWTYSTGPGNEYDDVWMLVEVTPDEKVVGFCTSTLQNPRAPRGFFWSAGILPAAA